MTTTFYIDANRKNSTHKSRTNNEWNYKLSNNIQLPPGTEIGIQNSFIHKQGISGATIQIDEEIKETLYFSYYLSDNPHFVPRSSTKNDSRTNNKITHNQAFVPSFLPHGLLEDNAFYPFSAQSNNKKGDDESAGDEVAINQIVGSELGVDLGMYHNQPLPCQRFALFEDDGTNQCRWSGNQFAINNNPYLMGYTEAPMMAIKVGKKTYTTQPNDLVFGGQMPNSANTDPIADTRGTSQDFRFEPYVKSIDIIIPAGEYSISEIADLIDGQINGKYATISEDDYYTDEIIQKQNNQTYDGNVSSNIFTRVEAFDRCGGLDITDPLNPQAGRFPDEAGAGTALVSGDLHKVFCQDTFQSITIGSPALESQKRWHNVNPTGKLAMGDCFNDRYAIPYFGDEEVEITYKADASGTEAQVNVKRYLLAYNLRRAGQVADAPYDKNNSQGFPPPVVKASSFLKGRKPVLPTEDQVMYVPIHHYNQLVKLWKYNDEQYQGGEAHINSYLNQTDNWTVNAKRLYRYGYQQRVSAYGDCQYNQSGENDPGDFSGNPFNRSVNAPYIGLHWKCKTNSMADVYTPGHSDPKSNAGGQLKVSPAQYSYDVMGNGYYLGTPDFQFTYDSDMSAFKMSGLHQQLRVPSCDIKGNPMANEGQTTMYMKRTSVEAQRLLLNTQNQLNKQNEFVNNYPEDPIAQEWNRIKNLTGGLTKAKNRLANTFNANEDRVGGVAVYNWAYQTALKYGDVNPETYTEVDVSGNVYKVYDNNYKYLWKFQDFFTTPDKAREAWEKSIWFKLGFSYDNLQNDENWEEHTYYDIPVQQYDNSDRDNTYFENRTQMFFRREDFKLYGKTTKSELAVDSAPTISTTFNNANYTYTPPNPTPDNKNGDPLHTIVRTYDNNNTCQPQLFGGAPYISSFSGLPTYNQNQQGQYQPQTDMIYARGMLLETSPFKNAYDSGNAYSGDEYGVSDGSMEKAYPNAFNIDSAFDNSNYYLKTRIPVATDSKEIVASGLPQLSQQGYLLITSDIVDGYRDEVKQGQPIPLLGVVPISNLSNQDFISADNSIIHTTQQVKNLNSIKIKILNPDLTEPTLLENSSVLLRITMPLPQNNPITPEQTPNQKREIDTKQPNPEDDETKSGKGTNT